MGMCFALKVTRPLISFTFIMSANSTLLQTAATLADTNPLASQFIVDLTNAELVSEMVDVIFVSNELAEIVKSKFEAVNKK
jgi:hypothetical protein